MRSADRLIQTAPRAVLLRASAIALVVLAALMLGACGEKSEPAVSTSTSATSTTASNEIVVLEQSARAQYEADGLTAAQRDCAARKLRASVEGVQINDPLDPPAAVKKAVAAAEKACQR